MTAWSLEFHTEVTGTARPNQCQEFCMEPGRMFPLVGASSHTSEGVVQSLVRILNVAQLLSGCISLGHLPSRLAAVERTSPAELGGSANGSSRLCQLSLNHSSQTNPTYLTPVPTNTLSLPHPFSCHILLYSLLTMTLPKCSAL